MIKLKDSISGGVFTDGEISKPFVGNDRERQCEAETADDQRVNILSRKARMFTEKLNNDQNALEDWNRVLDLDFANLAALRAIAAIRRRAGDPTELVNALQAFETQMPEVSRAKKRTLLRHYGVPEESLIYFDQHMMEEPHIAYGSWLAYRFANKQEFDTGYQKGAEVIYRSLDPFYPPRATVQ